MNKEVLSLEIFQKTIKILFDNNVNYWITDGTLLGLIREKRLLPWDSDIDFAVWKHEAKQEDIIKLFESNGYKLIKTLPVMDCLHFEYLNIRVDIGLYNKNKNTSTIKWATMPKTIFKLYFLKIINIIFEYRVNNKGTSKYYISNPVKKGIIYVVISCSSLIPQYALKRLFKIASPLYSYIGCSFPNDLMQFKTITLFDTKVSVPKEAEKYLELTYGKDWRIPNKDYIWEEDTCNLISFKKNND